MTRTLFLALLAAVPLALGCATRPTATVTTPKKGADDDKMTAAQRVQRAVPVLNRTVTQNDLNQLRTFMENAKAEKGSYPRSLDDLPGLAKDAPNLANAIKSGELVLAGGQNDILAYEAAALDDRGSVVTAQGVTTMTADELKAKLKSGR
jgi:hypothetical protein